MEVQYPISAHERDLIQSQKLCSYQIAASMEAAEAAA